MCRPIGPHFQLCPDPALTRGAIHWRRFAPLEDRGLKSAEVQPFSAHHSVPASEVISMKISSGYEQDNRAISESGLKLGDRKPALPCLRALAEGASPWAIAWPCIHEFIAVVTHPRRSPQ